MTPQVGIFAARQWSSPLLNTFFKYEEVDRFMKELSQEVSKRLKEVAKKGSHITLKVIQIYTGIIK